MRCFIWLYPVYIIKYFDLKFWPKSKTWKNIRFRPCSQLGPFRFYSDLKKRFESKWKKKKNLKTNILKAPGTYNKKRSIFRKNHGLDIWEKDKNWKISFFYFYSETESRLSAIIPCNFEFSPKFPDFPRILKLKRSTN